MTTITAAFIDARFRGISATEVKSIFKKAAVEGFTRAEVAELKAALDHNRDSFTAAGRAEYDKQITKAVVTVDAYARMTPTGPETSKLIASPRVFGANALLRTLPVKLEGAAATLSVVGSGASAWSLQVKPANGAVRNITSVDEARAIVNALKAHPLSANSMVALAASDFVATRDFSRLTFRSARATTNADRSLTLSADDGSAFTLKQGVITIDAGIARRELLPAEYASLARAIPLNVSVELNALAFAASRKAH